VRIPLLAFGIAVLCQFGLGVATLLFVVPAALAALHQCVAVLTLTAAVALLHATRLPAIGLRQ
jgi:cytochrome c oxidase assembly protein subunit 15